MKSCLKWVLSFVLVCAAQNLPGAQIEVNTSSDIQDWFGGTVAELLLDPGPDGQVSFREAVQAANNTPGPDTIVFADYVTGPILLGSGNANSQIYLTSDETTIVGEGTTVLDGSSFGLTEAGLCIQSAGNIVTGLTVINCPISGISIEGVNASGNQIENCRLGILNGTAAPNRYGITIRGGAHDNVIGWVGGSFKNVISGNSEVGVLIMESGTNDNSIVDCYIGTAEDGMSSVPNTWNGITIAYGALRNIVGGTIAGCANLISGNGRSGVFIYDDGTQTSGTAVFGNWIGVAADGQSPLPNGLWGVYLGNGPINNVIGGVGAGMGNIIRHNGRDGVEVNGVATKWNTIRGNSIHNNADLAIDLVGGANEDVAAPAITSIYPVAGQTQTPNGLVDLYADAANEGKEYVGTLTTDASGNFQGTFELAAFVGKNLTAAVTNASGSTSKFSAPRLIEDGGVGTATASVEITNADNLCRVYINGDLAVQTFATQAPSGGVQPGNSGLVDVTNLLNPGPNTFAFAVWNADDCCTASGHFEVKVNGNRVYKNGINESDSTPGVKFLDTYALEWDPTRGDLIVAVYESAVEPRQPIPFAVARVTGGLDVQTAEVGDDGIHRFLVERPGTYTVTVTASGRETMVTDPLPFAAGTFYTTLEFFPQPQSGGSVDSDGDGLTDEAEAGYGTNPNSADSDGDGMPDLFEVQYGLNNTTNDAQEDLDGDGFTNLREFQMQSNPADPGNPRLDFYVSPDGVDSGPGTQGAPWRTIQYAIDTVADLIGDAIGENVAAGLRMLADGTRATILADAGTYRENIELQPGIRLMGTRFGQSILEGTVTAAPFSSVVSLRVQEPGTGAAALVHVDSGSILLDRVYVVGRVGSQATGMLFEGSETRSVLVTDCIIGQVHTGMEIRGAAPLVRLTRFSAISANAIVLKADSGKQEDENTFGQAGDSGSGWNRFENIGGKVIVNERSIPLVMENNDWDTDDPAAIAALVEGPVDFEPYLAKGSGLLPCSIVCTVWDAVTRAPITNASVALAPGGINNVSENVDGVYSFAAIPPATYTVTVSAQGYDSLSESTDVLSGETASPVFALGVKGATPPNTRCQCGKVYSDTARPARAHAGNIFVSSLVIAIVSGAGYRRRRAIRPRERDNT